MVCPPPPPLPSGERSRSWWWWPRMDDGFDEICDIDLERLRAAESWSKVSHVDLRRVPEVDGEAAGFSGKGNNAFFEETRTFLDILGAKFLGNYEENELKWVLFWRQISHFHRKSVTKDTSNLHNLFHPLDNLARAKFFWASLQNATRIEKVILLLC